MTKAERNSREKLPIMLASAPTGRGLSRAEIDDWIAQNVDFRKDGQFRVKPPTAQAGAVRMESRGAWPFGDVI